ncbi:hypothetical protein BDZ97DRAFT_1927840 [Flammula alnicola]|nr:hypothetical protein BDZ97DRAFT_1927840 [Flammula alnicola]
MSWSGTMVDDSDPAITYTAAGPAVWFSETAADFVRFGSDNPGDPSSLADAFQGTAHVLRVSGLAPSANGSLSYNFNGSRVAVYSAYSALNALNFGQQEPMPSWECFVDGVSIVPNQAFNSFPWKSYCETDGLSPGSHLINMNILLFSATSEFWVDFIKYGPSQNTSASEPRVRFIDSTDLQLQYTGDWTPLGSANVTNPINQTSTVTIPFEGTSLAWYALSRSSIVTIDPGSFQNISSGAFIDGTYTIDGDNKSSTHFSAAYASPSINSPYNTMLFNTLTFPSGQHNLTVSFDCQAGLGVECPPITLDYFIVEPGFLAAATQLASPPNRNTKIIVGAVVGAAIGSILLGVFTVLFLRRHSRNRRGKQTEVEENSSSMAANTVHPFVDISDGKPRIPEADDSSSSTAFATAYASRRPRLGQYAVEPFIDGLQDKVPVRDPSTVEPFIDYPASKTVNTASSSDLQLMLDPSSNSTEALVVSSRSVNSSTRAQETQRDGQPGNEDDSSDRPIFVRHEDSGYRLPAARQGQNVFELPPEYTIE